MKKTDYENAALAACFQLHGELLADDAFAGYDGGKKDFDSLYEEIYFIVRFELPDGADCDQVVNTFYDYQVEICNGERDADWFR